MRNLASPPHPDPHSNDDAKTIPQDDPRPAQVTSNHAPAVSPRQLEEIERFLARQRAAMGFT